MHAEPGRMHDLPTTVVVKAFDEHDVSAARALMLVAWDAGGRNPYLETMLAKLDRAARQESSESLGLSAVIDDEVVGVVLFGIVAGSVGTAALHGIVVSDEIQRRGVGSALLRGVAKLLDAEQARLLIAEVPEGEQMRGYQSFLAHRGFSEEARIPDFVKDGTALAIWRRDLLERVQ